MLYVVYLNPEATFGGEDLCLLGTFLMREDAEKFRNVSVINNENLVIAEVDGAWNNWSNIRSQIKAKVVA